MGFNDFNTLSITEHHFSFIDINEDIYLSVSLACSTRRFNFPSNRLEVQLKSLT